MIVTKVSYNDLPNNHKKKVNDEKNNIFYKLTENGTDINIFSFYMNSFHETNLYISPTSNLIDHDNSKEILKNIAKTANRHIQLMTDSAEKEIIEKIENIGFKLMRETYELEYNPNDLKEFENKSYVIIEKYTKGLEEYNEAAIIAFNYYIETHLNINTLTASFEEFKEILPDEVICEIKDNEIINLVFVENNELCYFSSMGNESYDSFLLEVIQLLFQKHNFIFAEVDSTDKIALQFKYLFNESDEESSFNTYIFL